MNSIQYLLLFSMVGITLTSCVVSDYPEGHRGRPISSAFGTYDVLPDGYTGDAYYHQNRYYYGGHYERGVFHDQGRQYNDRYSYGGRYYYGGRNEHHAGRSQQPGHPSDSQNRDHRNDGHR